MFYIDMDCTTNDPMIFVPFFLAETIYSAFSLPSVDAVDSASREHAAETLELSYKRFTHISVFHILLSGVWLNVSDHCATIYILVSNIV